MEPYNRFYTGVMRIDDEYENTHIDQYSPSTQRALSAIVSVQGDRRKTNPHHWQKIRRDYARGELILDRSWAPSRYVSGLVGFPPPNFGPAADLAAAHTKCLAKIVDAIAHDRVQLGVTLAELQETAATGKQVLGATQKLARTTSNIRREYNSMYALGRNKRVAVLAQNAKAMREALSNAWLTWAVGVKPLIIDVHNFFDQRKAMDAEEYRYHVRETGSHKLREKVRGKDPYGLPQDLDTNSYAGVKYDVAVYVDNPLLHLAQRIGLTSPLSTVWEATRLSFVVDYFYNVGNYLQLSEDLLCASFNWQVEGWKTERQVITTTQNVGGKSDVVSGQSWSGKYFAYSKLVSHDRVRVTSLPLRAPAGPSLKLPQYAGQWATCAALLDGELRTDRSKLPMDSVRRGWK